MKKLKVVIEGMHCASCASSIERSLRKVVGVHEVTVNVMAKKGFVEADDTVSYDDVKKAVARAGYKVVAIEE